MRTKSKILKMFLILMVTWSWSWSPGFARADVEWTVKTQLDLKAPPLDVYESADGQWLFILTPEEILIYSIAEDKVMNRVPVDRRYDRVIHSWKNSILILTSSSENTVKVIQLEEIHKFDLSGLPFKGPENAPVTLAVFSDYQ
ncbi:MAG: hypothetical protein GTN81_06975 [Proteobacteria bacterium]|nr:hypothetical protein [Pseudomonadota bacterium]